MTRQLIFMGVSFGILVVVCTAFAAFSFSLKLTSKEDLADLRLRQLAPTKFVLSFKIPLESFYSPILVESKKLGDQTIVSVYKQLAVGPFRGLIRSLIANESTFEAMPQFDVDRQSMTAYVSSFKSPNPSFILRTFKAEFPIELKSE